MSFSANLRVSSTCLIYGLYDRFSYGPARYKCCACLFLNILKSGSVWFFTLLSRLVKHLCLHMQSASVVRDVTSIRRGEAVLLRFVFSHLCYPLWLHQFLQIGRIQTEWYIIIFSVILCIERIANLYNTMSII